jgi:hypothetical protein
MPMTEMMAAVVAAELTRLRAEQAELQRELDAIELVVARLLAIQAEHLALKGGDAAL